MVRIVALLSSYPPGRRIGAWIATHSYLAYLVARGHHVDVFTRADRGPVDSLDDVTIGTDTDAAVSAAMSSADVVVSHAGNTVRAAAVAARWRKPNVRMAHGMIPDPEVLEGAALVVFNSHNLATSVDCRSPWIVCHPPVVAEEFRTEPGDRVTLVNLSEQKGGELFWRLVRCAPHRRFLGVVGAHGNQYIERAANAEIIGTTGDMRGDVYARTRLLLMPSDQETWGMTAIEAAASGIPTIASDLPGLRESLDDAGIYVDRADGQAWLDAIERLHDPTEWSAASAAVLVRSAELDPTADLDRFLDAMEGLVV